MFAVGVNIPVCSLRVERLPYLKPHEVGGLYSCFSYDIGDYSVNKEQATDILCEYSTVQCQTGLEKVRLRR